MKFRQAKKIIKRELNHQVKGRMSWYGNIWGCPSWLKVTTVYVHHMKKNHRYFVVNGIVRELRYFYEKRDYRQKEIIHE